MTKSDVLFYRIENIKVYRKFISQIISDQYNGTFYVALSNSDSRIGGNLVELFYKEDDAQNFLTSWTDVAHYYNAYPDLKCLKGEFQDYLKNTILLFEKTDNKTMIDFLYKSKEHKPYELNANMTSQVVDDGVLSLFNSLYNEIYNLGAKKGYMDCIKDNLSTLKESYSSELNN